MIGNVVITETDALMHAALKKVEKYVSFGQLVGTTESIMLELRRHTK
jgi:hypothetical protein